MQHPEPRIQCSNPQCAASNTLEASCCHRCNTPIVRRYLWSIKEAISQEQVQTLISNRYLAFSTRIFLDTKPNKPPSTPEEVPPDIINYLQLFPCYPNVPQVYGLLEQNDAWLLDYGTVPIDDLGHLANPQEFIPSLESSWSNATAFKQLNWLWQIAKLWKPLSTKKVASTILDLKLLQINGQIVQVRQLKQDGAFKPTLKDLGIAWKDLIKESRSEIQDVIKQITIHLETGKITKISQVIALLDRAASQCQKNKEYSYEVYALSDSGPNRSNNEDAAFPLNEFEEMAKASNTALAIVCDGVGGHDGGEVASQTTIQHIHDEISSLDIGKEQHSSGKILEQLTKYINDANDLISERNDSEQRQERQRMGTTLVMSLARAHEMYLAHVGDSRIYWITSNSCHQVTTDDDLASREVRLGYAIYRDSLQYPSAGALIQALGMRDSAALHPNLQRYLIDEDCIFLLCSDGLSDFDRVEQQWRHKILPVLEGKQNIIDTVKNLIHFANEENGHDNVTVALVHCQVKTLADSANGNVSWSDIQDSLEDSSLWSENNLTDSIWSDSESTENSPADTDIPQQQISDELQIGELLPPKKQPLWLKPLIFVLLIFTIIGSVTYCGLEDKKDDSIPPTNESGQDIREKDFAT